MKYRLRPYIQTVLLATTLTICSCEDDWLNLKTDNSKYICFDTELLEVTTNATTRSHSEHLMMDSEDWPLIGTTSNTTRIIPTKSLSGEAGVIGYKDSETSPVTELNDKSYTFENDAMRATSSPVAWDDVNNVTTTLHLFAYAPYSVVHGESPAATINSAAATPTLTYTVPDTYDTQIDLLSANADVAKASFGSSVPLTFNHILTALRFKVDFPCKVKSLTVNGVNNVGTYTYGSGWSSQTGLQDYSFGESYFTADGKDYEADTYLNRNENTLMLLPQTVPAGANVQLVYSTDDGANWNTLTASIARHEWQLGKRITYTISRSGINYIYFDLALGDITINASTYSGKIMVNGVETTVNGTHNSSNEYYVFQSNSINKTTTGWETTLGSGTCRIPNYTSITYEGKSWKDYITNRNEDPNTHAKGAVQLVSEAWATSAESVGRQFANASTDGSYFTDYRIDVRGAIGTCNMLLDNIYTRYQPENNEAGTLYNSNHTGSITYLPSGKDNKLILDFVGDNWLGSIRYYNNISDNGNQLILQGTGSLSVANNPACINYAMKNWASCIGGSNDGQKNAYGIVINSGIYFVGATIQDNASAIGGGSNGHASITINGGKVTAVTASNATALGGGGGRNSIGGNGNIIITGGNVYAYNFKNPLNLPSAAIGGAGTSNTIAGEGIFYISGGNVYAQSCIGTAIGGGSSLYFRGGNATVNISGGNVIAKSTSYLNEGAPGYIPAGCGIGGGTACSGGGSSGKQNGGSATITIRGGNILTGSIGGGRTGDTGAKNGYANITIENGDIQGQFVMEAGTSGTPSFTMTGGRIRNSHATDNSEYENIVPYGGAVYIEDGTFNMNGGTIESCSATKGGAVYIKKSGSSSPSFTMSGDATIKDCSSTSHGGAVYLEGGQVTINEGRIDKNSSSGSGGGIYVCDGSFTMNDGDITGNYASTHGGGVAVTSTTSDVSVTISGGNIIDNWTDKSGGGISVIPSSGHSAFVTLGVDNQGNSSPDISRNGAAISGGGVYVKKDAGVPYARLTINSGKIKNNLVSTLVANPDVANDGGFVILKDGDVKHVIVTYHMNDGSIPETTSTQKIVTATRSTLNMPSWTISGYTLSWSDNPSGGGTSYTNGQEVNLTSGLHIYAHWTAQ